MPNNITNTISFGSNKEAMKAFQEMLELIRADNSFLGSVDFNKLIPMPDNIYTGNLGVNERMKYGKNNWKDWSIDHWGTKWNAYECIPADQNTDTLQFFTAWEGVPKIAALISKRFPEQKLTYRWADEDIGFNVGEMVFQNGSITEKNIPDAGSREAYEMAADLLGVDLADWGYVLTKDGKRYEYDENRDSADKRIIEAALTSAKEKREKPKDKGQCR